MKLVQETDQLVSVTMHIIIINLFNIISPVGLKQFIRFNQD